jgi:hypothetical protein
MSSTMVLTTHAQRRLQQRSIPGFVLELLLQFGTRVQQNGSERIFFDKAARREVKRFLGIRIYSRIEDLLDVYAIVSRDGCVVTAGYRLERMNHG